ncbi:putative homeobox domain-containing protein [Golovinomyces cichoracearum]|uniref:Putative homeobox domain-containing protein n=1 Tax=Golovinomyces cichoracearum TaxID=62708 RepID=A0A420J6P4_9PEZI|nr:putative homeobox domain-containing protein [Golovinomyces cichoracearum]
MLVARPCDFGRNPWSSRKLEALHKTKSSRMPNPDTLSAQADWREQYSSLHPLDEQNSDSPNPAQENLVDGSFTMLDQDRSRNTQAQQNSLKKFNLRDRLESQGDGLQWSSENNTSSIMSLDPNRSLITSDSANMSLVSIGFSPLNSKSCGSTTSMHEVTGGNRYESGVRDQDEEPEDDEDMDAGSEEGAQTKTDAERPADRRKMKRFRLTHQQTRFLMSEFSKQAHPDAAHRERLSREIPGLSPRQVQVWFQNRRAKIKRLTADDRDRMIKMRAVPENFDSRKALHSPYGAVQGVLSPKKSSVGFGLSYSENLMRPLIMEPINSTHEVHVSPKTNNPAFSNSGFNSNTSLCSPDNIPPSTSLNSPNQYYGTHIPSPMSTLSRGTSSFNIKSNILTPSQSCHSRNIIRPQQPSQFREDVSKLRPESLQSSLMLNISYNQSEQRSPQLSGQQLSVDQHEFSTRELNSHQYDTYTFSEKSNIGSSPSNFFPTSQGTVSFFEPNNLLSMSRIRAASANIFPNGLDLRNQFQGSNPTPLTTPTSNSFGSSFSVGFISAPQTAFRSSSQDFIDSNSPKPRNLSTTQSDRDLIGAGESDNQ